MRTFPIALDAPFLYLASLVVERNEDILIKTFFAVSAHLKFTMHVLDRLSRFAELEPYKTVMICSSLNRAHCPAAFLFGGY
jgi:hypothetical protein